MCVPLAGPMLSMGRLCVLSLVIGGLALAAQGQKHPPHDRHLCEPTADRCTTPPPPPPEIANYFQRRRTALAFFRSMEVLAEPSTVSSAVFNWGRGRSRWNPLDNSINSDPDRDKIPYILNGDIQPRIPLGKRWMIGKMRWSNPLFFNMHFIPWFKVRLLSSDEESNDSSNPVRTPSYMPGFESFFTMGNWWKPNTGVRSYLSVQGYHHSNGQDATGGEFVDGYFNTYNGDFSDDFVVHLNIGRLWRTVADSLKPARISPAERTQRGPGTFRITHIKAGVSFHPSMTDTVMPFYGNLRGHLVLTRITAPLTRDVVRDKARDCYYTDEPMAPQERFRFEARMSMILDAPADYQRGPYADPRPIAWSDLGKRMNLYGTLYYRFPHVPTTAAFAQVGYFGSDPYNAYFQESQFFWRIGIGMGFFVDDDPDPRSTEAQGGGE
ncbi:MAG: hypothetical protein KA352_05100 [Flavobacteriales bacterium]|nr:hypothetical protein [Flavobacteriales bacterium]